MQTRSTRNKQTPGNRKKIFSTLIKRIQDVWLATHTCGKAFFIFIDGWALVCVWVCVCVCVCVPHYSICNGGQKTAYQFSSFTIGVQRIKFRLSIQCPLIHPAGFLTYRESSVKVFWKRLLLKLLPPVWTHAYSLQSHQLPSIWVLKLLTSFAPQSPLMFLTQESNWRSEYKR